MRDGPKDAIAVIFAGGAGTRMHRPGLPKQFVVAGDRPVLAHTLQHFQDHPKVSGIYIACLEPFIPHAWSLVRRYRIEKVRRIVSGGATALASIFNALESAVEDGVDERTATLIHDGVRPIINADLITRNIAATYKYGGAISAIPCFETIARSVDGARTIDEVPQRDLMYVLQAPQTFPLGEVHRANRRSMDEGLQGRFVDEAQLMTHYGCRLRMVSGLRGNVKLTTEFDLLQFSLLLDSGALDPVQGANVA
ncbi:IspD/TarI family cytidylyltransferase [Phenylobacterium sp.]|uniref:IspD/TarI family cytidylyltransferase n=1 Tax=Phenylobacterium sp. TaxID=1871053 RepID=UPI002810E0F3|nr:IspD/TarI family cytidylyltransferase [Phenylobacterium sp.]